MQVIFVKLKMLNFFKN